MSGNVLTHEILKKIQELANLCWNGDDTSLSELTSIVDQYQDQMLENAQGSTIIIYFVHFLRKKQTVSDQGIKKRTHRVSGSSYVSQIRLTADELNSLESKFPFLKAFFDKHQDIRKIVLDFLNKEYYSMTKLT